MKPKKPKGFGKFDKLMKKLVKVPPDELPAIGTRMRAGRVGASCEVCGQHINIGDIYFITHDEHGTIKCERCAESK